VLDAFTTSLDRVFLTAVPILVVGFVLALFLPEVPLRTSHADQPSPAAALVE